MSEQRGHNNRTNERPWSVSPPGGERGERGMEKMGGKKRRGQKFYLGCIACIHKTNEQLLIVLQRRHM